MPTSTSTAKRCVNCNKDVAGQKRMKDSSGRYWCIKCGAADQLKKGQTGTPCGGCGEHYPPEKLTKYGAARLCNGCYKAATKGPGLRAAMSGGSGETSKAKLIGMLVVMGLLAVASAYQFMNMHHH